MKRSEIRPEFVESAPAQLIDGVLYISDRFRTALHKCCCGCGREVVTPLNPAKWSYIQQGNLVTLKPSIGNWSFECRSHYHIIRNKVVWGQTFTTRQIATVKARDARDRQSYIFNCNKAKANAPAICSKWPACVPKTTTCITLALNAMRRWWEASKR